MAPKKASTASSAAEEPTHIHWLLKAEPETRIEKGVDVKFSIDDFEECKVTSWEGVRNHEAKKIMKEKMQLGQKCLFYASNCKVPGITGLAKVVKTGYPDHNAWDPKHPYYDPKSDPKNPTWYMVDLEFISRLQHLVPLKLLQTLSLLPSPPPSTPYLTASHLSAIANSALIKRGRLSVQPASEGFYEAVKLLGEKGGWEELMPTAKGKGGAKKVEKEGEAKEGEEKKGKAQAKKPVAAGKKRKSAAKEEEAGEGDEEKEEVIPKGSSSRPIKKRK